MRHLAPRRRSAALTSALAVIAAGALLALPGTGRAATPAAGRTGAAAACSASSTITKKLPGGTTWRMCYRNSPTAGLVLTHVTYQPKHESRPIEVLGSARLAQIHVPYDNGSQEYDDVTGENLGDEAQLISPKDCPGGTIRPLSVSGEDGGRATVKGLCVTTQPRGFAYRGDSAWVNEEHSHVDSAQGRDLVVYTVNSVGWYDYITQWNFSDDGMITAKEGATGNLSPTDFNASDGTGRPLGRGAAAKAVSHQHDVLWKLDFKPDGSWKSKVEQYDSRPDGTSSQGIGRLKTTHQQLTTERAGDLTNNRWWRVVSTAGRNKDGHPRSWEIVPGHSDTYSARPYTRHDLYVTQYKACEQYASGNNAVHARSSCKDDVSGFVDGERLTRPVLWVNIGFHHLARDEDQTPMPVHWQGFQIAPRDVTDMSPLTPDRLHRPEFNGEPHEAGVG